MTVSSRNELVWKVVGITQPFDVADTVSIWLAVVQSGSIVEGISYLFYKKGPYYASTIQDKQVSKSLDSFRLVKAAATPGYTR
jgi:hypothetical protein